jgi:hypothetical protein
MATDPAVRQEAHNKLTSLFEGLGRARQEKDSGGGGGLGDLGGIADQVQEFLEMPLDIAMIFINMSTQLAEMILKSLEEAGIVLVKGMTPM